jgi:hypothetical protein
MLAWIGNLLIVVGLWKIGDKWRHAFLFSIAGELAYVARSVLLEDWALAFICVVFCAMAAINWVKWGRQTNQEDPELRALRTLYEMERRAHASTARVLASCMADMGSRLDAVKSGRERLGPRPEPSLGALSRRMLDR